MSPVQDDAHAHFFGNTNLKQVTSLIPGAFQWWIFNI